MLTFRNLSHKKKTTFYTPRKSLLSNSKKDKIDEKEKFQKSI